MEMHRGKPDAEPDHDRPKRRLAPRPRTQVRSRLFRPGCARGNPASRSPREVHARCRHSSRGHLTMAITIEIDHARAKTTKTATKTVTKTAKGAGAATVVPQAVKGRIRRIKWAVLVVTLGVYYLA